MPARPPSTSGDNASQSTTSKPRSQGPSPSLKTLLKAADTLLKPPDPLPSAPSLIVKRLRACSKCLPKDWRRITPEWKEEDELDQVGDDAVVENANVDEATVARKEARRDQLVMIVAKRSFAIVKAVHKWLEMEFWPKDQRYGLDHKDFLLGTADLRLIRIMLSWTNPTRLLFLTASYVDRLPEIDSEVADTLEFTINSLLEIIKPSVPPAPAAGPSSRVPAPPTVITQTLIASHLLYIGLAALMLAWTPSVPQEKYAKLRNTIVDVFMSLPPAFAISTLGSTLKLLSQGRTTGEPRSNGWLRKWPNYPDGRVNQLLTLQVRRPGGVRGMMEVMLGESAKKNDGSTIDGARLDHIFNLLVRIPQSMTQETYYPWLLAELFSLIPINDSSPAHPTDYVSSACYCIQRFWSSNAPGVAEWLKAKLHAPWTPSTETWLSKSLERPNDDGVTVTTSEAIQRSIQNMRFLLLYNPSTPAFADFLLGPILIPLFSLHSYLNEIRDTLFAISKNRQNGRLVPTPAQALQDDVMSLLKTWGKMVEPNIACRGIWSIVDGKAGWSTMQPLEDGPTFYWQGQGSDVRLVAGREDGPSFDVASEESAPDHLDFLPKETARRLKLLCELVQALDRSDITSEIMLRALDLWRISEAAGTASQADILLKFCLSLEIMRQCGPQAFGKPKQMLSLIERVLHDYAKSLVFKKPVSLIEEVVPVNPDIVGNDMLVNLACRLLESLNVLHQAQGDIFDTRLVHPILKHLNTITSLATSTIVREETRGARMMLTALGTDKNRTDGSVNGSREKHQQAVTFASDPELPVRALGLNMLKELVSSPDFDKSLASPILDVYLSNLKDNDSFVYLNAVNGLSEMVDVLGKEVFTKLAGAYRQGAMKLGGGNPTEEQINLTLRLGEALNQVVKRVGDALGNYAESIVPTLMAIYPDDKLPVVIRTSALSLISVCGETCYLSILPWTTGLADSLLDLLQVESIVSSPFRPVISETDNAPRAGEPGWKPMLKKKIQLVDDEEPEEEEERRELELPRIIDEEPIKANSKHPALRRAALVLLDRVFRSIATKLWPDTIGGNKPLISIDKSSWTKSTDDIIDSIISSETLERSRTILNYLTKTDQDEIVRNQSDAVLNGANVLWVGMGMGMGMGVGVGMGSKQGGILSLDALKLMD